MAITLRITEKQIIKPISADFVDLTSNEKDQIATKCLSHSSSRHLSHKVTPKVGSQDKALLSVRPNQSSILKMAYSYNCCIVLLSGYNLTWIGMFRSGIIRARQLGRAVASMVFVMAVSVQGLQVSVIDHGNNSHGEVDFQAIDDGHAKRAEHGKDKMPSDPRKGSFG